MVKLTDAQLTLLSNARARDDGAASLPAKMPRPAAAKVAASLIVRTLMRETQTKPGMPIWREDGDGHGVSLVITRAGRDAFGVKEAAKKTGSFKDIRRGAAENLPAQQRQSTRPRQVVVEANSREEPDPAAAEKAGPRAGSKLALIIEMLAKEEGATIAALMGATGWQSHTTRAVLTGLRKRGFVIERRRVDGGDTSNYRIAATAGVAA